MSAQRFISGIHFIQFDHWPLRWLYFALGLSGCVMIATGYIYWPEVWAFYLVWLASFAHAWLRPGRAWREQCWAMAALALLAPVLNWVTTGDHLLKTLLEGYWPVAGMDGLLLTGAGIAVYAARKLSASPLAGNAHARWVSQGTEAADVG